VGEVGTVPTSTHLSVTAPLILSAAKDLVRPSRQTLRGTQSLPSEKRRGDSLQGICHPERREGSRADFWGITRATDC